MTTAKEFSSMQESDLKNLMAQHMADKLYREVAGYSGVYWRWFNAQRLEVRRLLEIGVGAGGSLRTWQEFFPNATIHAIDNCPKTVRHMEEQFTVFLGSQGDCDFLKWVIAKTGGQWDIIIDDGNHVPNDQKASFLTLFPALKQGGVYVVEDTHVGYSQQDNDQSPELIASFLGGLVHNLHTCDLLGKWIKSIHFYYSICFIQKLESLERRTEI